MEGGQKYFDAYLKQFGQLSDEIINFLRQHLALVEKSKGDFYLQSGEVQSHMGYVSSGLLRRYYINDKGNEITTGFIKENEYLTDYPAFIRQQSTKYYMQCLEPCIIIDLPYNIIQESYSRFKSSEMQGRLIAEKVLTILSDRVESFLFNTAEERYLAFLEENEELMNRVSLTHLASFLGIERQSLSRIRKRISQK
ncbi:Crp/Fnr family transcriptional regulator [Fulvivirga maritima]|uniref:Crp/Fnr family transcriptional regulator n=1 Tax=Fulvivirga maritima TaxID=2904247 RepID=UPI001F44CA51|nr:Crp/Fnr family transcriptional regulator [Fulvivirga maritima]UII25172.1 Crp/Fnr family transcriptional regulator [Fulvivirga maritima]